MQFEIGNVIWQIKFVEADSSDLLTSLGDFTVGVCDNNTKTVYLSNLLHGKFLKHVLCHELCHCFSFVHNLDIPIETEEIIANFVADYGEDVIYLLDDLIKNMKRRVA